MVAAESISKGQFACEYKTSRVYDVKQRTAEEARHSRNGLGCFIIKTKHAVPDFCHLCFNASERFHHPGRYINHVAKGPNVRLTRPHKVRGKVRIGLLALRDIPERKELCYDYGDRSGGEWTPTPSGPPPVATLPRLPLFTPDPAVAGLHLLAAAAANERSATSPPRVPPSGMSPPLAPHTLLGLPPAPPTLASSPAALALLTKPGPFNPAASLPAKVVKRILDLEFVEMAEVTVDDNLQGSGRPPAPAQLPVTDISQWLERFSLMAAILTTRFPEKAVELFAYQATIVRAERNYEGKRWVSYDQQFHREALARRDLNWSVTDPRLYNEAFTGRARAIARCSYCLQDDHTAPRCPKNPNRPVFGWFPDPSVWPAQAGGRGLHRPPPTTGRGHRQTYAAVITTGDASKPGANTGTPATTARAPTPG